GRNSGVEPLLVGTLNEQDRTVLQKYTSRAGREPRAAPAGAIGVAPSSAANLQHGSARQQASPACGGASKGKLTGMDRFLILVLRTAGGFPHRARPLVQFCPMLRTRQ